MLAKIIHEITQISEDTSINLENYMESINFINNVYNFINKIKMVAPVTSMTFKPTFKGRMTCEKFNIDGSVYENEMRYFVVDSALFLEDKEQKKQQIRDELGSICESIEFDATTVRFILK